MEVRDHIQNICVLQMIVKWYIFQNLIFLHLAFSKYFCIIPRTFPVWWLYELATILTMY